MHFIITEPLPFANSSRSFANNFRNDTSSANSSNTASEAADNTVNNKTDVANSGATADQQGNGKTDLQLTASVRQSIVADSSLSTYAHNVKIVVKNGVATIKGPVRTEEEKETVAAKAAAVVGQDHVVNQMEIATQ
jgi:hyperosmotically inducible periplasmic protein